MSSGQPSVAPAAPPPPNRAGRRARLGTGQFASRRAFDSGNAIPRGQRFDRTESRSADPAPRNQRGQASGRTPKAAKTGRLLSGFLPARSPGS